MLLPSLFKYSRRYKLSPHLHSLFVAFCFFLDILEYLQRLRKSTNVPLAAESTFYYYKLLSMSIHYLPPTPTCFHNLYFAHLSCSIFFTLSISLNIVLAHFGLFSCKKVSKMNFVNLASPVPPNGKYSSPEQFLKILLKKSHREKKSTNPTLNSL